MRKTESTEVIKKLKINYLRFLDLVIISLSRKSYSVKMISLRCGQCFDLDHYRMIYFRHILTVLRGPR